MRYENGEKPFFFKFQIYRPRMRFLISVLTNNSYLFIYVCEWQSRGPQNTNSAFTPASARSLGQSFIHEMDIIYLFDFSVWFKPPKYAPIAYVQWTRRRRRRRRRQCNVNWHWNDIYFARCSRPAYSISNREAATERMGKKMLARFRCVSAQIAAEYMSHALLFAVVDSSQLFRWLFFFFCPCSGRFGSLYKIKVCIELICVQFWKHKHISKRIIHTFQFVSFRIYNTFSLFSFDFFLFFLKNIKCNAWALICNFWDHEMN